MKTKILLTIIATILLAGLLVAGLTLTISEITSTRNSTLTNDEKTALTNVGLTEIYVSKLECDVDYCRFEVVGNGIQTTGTINKYTINCTYLSQRDLRECETPTAKETNLGIKVKCINMSLDNLVKRCIATPKSNLLNERDTMVDNLLLSIAGQVNKTITRTSIGDNEKVVIGKI